MVMVRVCSCNSCGDQVERPKARGWTALKLFRLDGGELHAEGHLCSVCTTALVSGMQTSPIVARDDRRTSLDRKA